MTLIIGIKAKGAVILASDSQITTGTMKRTDSAKMETVDFLSFPVIVAQSGDLVYSNRFVDIFSSLARGKDAETPEEIGMMAQDAMRKLRAEIRESHFNCTSDELDDRLRRDGTQVGIMIGFFLKKESHLLSINLAYATYRKSRFFYEADGCGATLGEFLLAEHTSQDMEMRVASVVALYIVEIVKKYDAMCGGDTKIGVLTEHDGTGLPSVGYYPKPVIEKCAKLLSDADENARPERLKTLHDKILSPDFETFETIYFGQ